MDLPLRTVLIRSNYAENQNLDPPRPARSVALSHSSYQCDITRFSVFSAVTLTRASGSRSSATDHHHDGPGLLVDASPRTPDYGERQYY